MRPAEPGFWPHSGLNSYAHSRASDVGSIPIARSINSVDAVGFTGFRPPKVLSNCPILDAVGRGIASGRSFGRDEKACFVETQVPKVRLYPRLPREPIPQSQRRQKGDANSELRARDPRRKPEAGFENWLPFFGVSNLLSCPQLTPTSKKLPNNGLLLATARF
jgi:hypothetical protein